MRMTFRHMDGVVSFSYNKGRPLFGMGHDGPNWYVDGDDVYVYFRSTGGTPNCTSRTKLVPVSE